MHQALAPQRKSYIEDKNVLLQALLDEFAQIVPPMFDDEYVVALAWDYGVSPAVLERLYIQSLDGVS